MTTSGPAEPAIDFAILTDPEIEARRQRIARVLLETNPNLGEELRSEGELRGFRAALRGLLAGRELLVTPDQDGRIEGCADLHTLKRWMSQAITAPTAAEALR